MDIGGERWGEKEEGGEEGEGWVGDFDRVGGWGMDG